MFQKYFYLKNVMVDFKDIKVNFYLLLNNFFAINIIICYINSEILGYISYIKCIFQKMCFHMILFSK